MPSAIIALVFDHGTFGIALGAVIEQIEQVDVAVNRLLDGIGELLDDTSIVYGLISDVFQSYSPCNSTDATKHARNNGLSRPNGPGNPLFRANQVNLSHRTFSRLLGGVIGLFQLVANLLQRGESLLFNARPLFFSVSLILGSSEITKLINRQNHAEIHRHANKQEVNQRVKNRTK